MKCLENAFTVYLNYNSFSRVSFLISDNFCHGKPNGNYEDPDTCYGFISCSNGIAYKMACPAGLRYNKKKDQCDWPSNVPCSKPFNLFFLSLFFI